MRIYIQNIFYSHNIKVSEGEPNERARNIKEDGSHDDRNHASGRNEYRNGNAQNKE